VRLSEQDRANFLDLFQATRRTCKHPHQQAPAPANTRTQRKYTHGWMEPHVRARPNQLAPHQPATAIRASQAIAQGDGAKAGRLMLSRSREHHCAHPGCTPCPRRRHAPGRHGPITGHAWGGALLHRGHGPRMVARPCGGTALGWRHGACLGPLASRARSARLPAAYACCAPWRRRLLRCVDGRHRPSRLRGGHAPAGC